MVLDRGRSQTMWTVRGEVAKMSMFVHVGGWGTYSNVHVVFFPANFGHKFENCRMILAKNLKIVSFSYNL